MERERGDEGGRRVGGKNEERDLVAECSDRETETERSFDESFWKASLRICIPRLSPESKGGFPYIPLTAGYRNGG
jgi:hypothetical protein